MWEAASIFILVYIFLMISSRYRWLITWTGVGVALILGALDIADVYRGVDWNIIGILFGSLLLADAFVYSRMPETISDHLINRSPNLGISLMLIIVFASVFSIFMDNVVTVLVIAPIALQVTRKAGINPVPVIIGLAISSNLQGMAILIGDTPSMILAARTPMDFLDFFYYNHPKSSYHSWKVGIFWIVQVGAVAGFVVLYHYFRGEKRKPSRLEITPVKSWFPLAMLVLAVILLSFASVIDPGFTWFGGVSTVIAGGISYFYVRARKFPHQIEDQHGLDWETVMFLAGIFILVYMLEKQGVIDSLVTRFGLLEGASDFLILTAVVWFSVAVSAFIDNVPYIAAMFPVVHGLAEKLGIPHELLFLGVLIGSCMGGNITPIGAAANLTATGILRREGRPVSFGSFVRIGLPFTVAATTVSYLLLYLIYRIPGEGS